jgi:hypothetical protein
MNILTVDRTTGIWSVSGAVGFPSSFCVQTGSEAHPASCLVSTGGPFSGAKVHLGCEADHFTPSSANVKNE